MTINYKSYEFRVYEHITRLNKLLDTGIVPDEELKQLRFEVNTLRQDFETKHFRVAVVGEFNRGKTSFVNALLGRRILPEDYMPTTAAINRITYSDTPDAYVVMKDGSKKTIKMEELAKYITKLSDETTENASQIQEAVVEYPSLFCRNGVDLIDTPGMNDDESMNQVTVSYLEEIDLAIVAVDASLPFSMTECAFTTQLLESPQVCQMIIVITKIDMIREHERQKLIDYMADRIRKDVKARLTSKYAPNSKIMRKYDDIFGNLCVYPISALEALDALSCNDMELFEKSGFKRLNHELPEIIMSSQNNSVILNTERVLNIILQKYRDHILGIQEQRQLLIPALDEMKQNFAQVSYENTAKVFGRQEQELSTLFLKIEEEQVDIRKKFIKALAEMKVLSLEELTRVFAPVMKTIFQTLNTKYHANERTWKEKYSKEILYPFKEQLYQKWETLLQPFPNLYEGMKPELKGLEECFELIRPETQEESFYWVNSPIPSEAVLSPDWNIMPYVESTIRYDLADYQKRCRMQMEGILMQSQKRLDNRVQELVRKLYVQVEIYIKQENREEDEKDMLKKLWILEKDSRELTEEFFKESVK